MHHKIFYINISKLKAKIKSKSQNKPYKHPSDQRVWYEQGGSLCWILVFCYQFANVISNNHLKEKVKKGANTTAKLRFDSPPHCSFVISCIFGENTSVKGILFKKE